MRIAIIGTGNVGSAIARGLRGKGHTVLLGARDSQADDLAALAAATGATPKLPAEAAAEADIIVLALPWGAAESAVKALGPLTGKTVIDCMNPLGMVDGALGLTWGHSTSGGEIVQGWLPGAHVVKTLNQVGAEIMAKNDHLPHRPVMFMAGDDAGAKAQVAALLTDLGFEALDAGDITKSRLLEPFGMVWINQALFRGKGRSWAFAAVSA
ncbi:NADPH-dependent F420 reductase [Tabrizicola thermarum]|uniref:NADPH-dependent F420 reductase n=1 Tax=Tabrizicola thermarum TaxID=2670345 RepID=UPI000FFCBD3E|nr:NAD(P)-binding domain-containing protein [Tabrizicola thermarum]